MRFSERIGKREIKTMIQKDSMDDELRNGLWNVIIAHFHQIFDQSVIYMGMSAREQATREKQRQSYRAEMLVKIWFDFFKRPVDEIRGIYHSGMGGMMGMNQPIPSIEPIGFIRKYFMECSWLEVYDFVDFMANTIQGNNQNDYVRDCNRILKREMSGYRFVGDKLTNITSEEEIQEIEKALSYEDMCTPVSRHLKTAIDFYSDRKEPNYPNAVKEAFSAVEAMCQILTNKSNCTLIDALNVLENKGGIKLHKALKDAYVKLYAYTSDAEGIRHAQLKEGNLEQEDARYLIIICSAFVNYLKEKQNKLSEVSKDLQQVVVE